MAKIMTVRGAIAPEELGFTSMHEHILMKGKVFRQSFLDENPNVKEKISGDAKVSLENTGLIRRNNMLTWDAQDLDDEEAMAGEVADFKESGGSAILELSVPGIRSNVSGIKRISQRTGVHIIAATGFYLQASWPDEFASFTLEDFRDRMFKEIEYGIDETGIKPGCIKIGMTHLTKQEEKALRAAVHVAKETGLSLSIHPSSGIGGDGRSVLSILREEGMNLERTVIAHAGGSFAVQDLRTLITNPKSWELKIDYAKELLSSGVNISVEFLNQSDREIEGQVNPTDWQKLAGVVALLKEGYAKQIVLGTDLCAKPMARRFGGEGYGRLIDFAIPALKNFAGVSSYAIRQMTIENPARILAY